MAIIHPSMLDPSSVAWRTPEQYITNGAYKLEKWAVNDRVVMVRNPQYRDADKVKISKIVVLPMNDENATLNEDLRILSQSRRDEATKTQLEDKYRRALVYIDCLQSKLGPASAPLSRRNFPLTNSNKIRGN